MNVLVSLAHALVNVLLPTLYGLLVLKVCNFLEIRIEDGLSHLHDQEGSRPHSK